MAPRDMSIAVVVFTCPPGDRDRLDIARGPCVTVGGAAPLVSVHAQHFGDTLEQVEALSSTLTGLARNGVGHRRHRWPRCVRDVRRAVPRRARWTPRTASGSRGPARPPRRGMARGDDLA